MRIVTFFFFTRTFISTLSIGEPKSRRLLSTILPLGLSVAVKTHNVQSRLLEMLQVWFACYGRVHCLTI